MATNVAKEHLGGTPRYMPSWSAKEQGLGAYVPLVSQRLSEMGVLTGCRVATYEPGVGRNAPQIGGWTVLVCISRMHAWLHA